MRFSVLEVADVKNLLPREQSYLDTFFTLCRHNLINSCPIAGCTRGRVASQETRDKIAACHLGKKHSEETKLLMSEAKKGKKFSSSHCLALSVSHKHKSNVEKLIKNRVKKPMIVVNGTDSYFVWSIDQFCKVYHLSRPFMTRIALGQKQVHRKKWQCHFATEEECHKFMPLVPEGNYYIKAS